MSIAGFVLSRFGPAFGWTTPQAASEPRLRRGAVERASVAAAARPKNRLLAALEAHTRRQIDLALGERAAEFHSTIRENRAVETRKEQM